MDRRGYPGPRDYRLVDRASGDDTKNARRFELIDREVSGTLSADEASELKDLQDDLRRYRRRVTPLPLGETRRLLDELVR